MSIIRAARREPLCISVDIKVSDYAIRDVGPVTVSSMAWRLTTVDSTQAGTRPSPDAELLGHGFEEGPPADAAGRRAGSWLNDKWRRALSRDFGERPLPFRAG